MSERFLVFYQKLAIRYPRWIRQLTIWRTAQLAGDIRMECDLRDLVQRKILYDGFWEPLVTRTLSALLREGDVFVDVGAHIGYYSLHACRRVGTTGMVLAFEPSPRQLDLLIRNVLRNGMENILCYSCALGESIQWGWLHQSPPSNVGMTSMRPLPHSHKHAVPSASFDAIVPADLRDRVSVVKVDVEGWETAVLRGMMRMLSSPRPPSVLCELIDRNLREAGTSADEVLALMGRLGYYVFAAPTEAESDVRWSLCPVDAGDSSGTRENVLFLHRSRANNVAQCLAAAGLLEMPPQPLPLGEDSP